MTFIVNYFLNKLPVFHGDALITTKIDLGEKVKLPILNSWGDEHCDRYISSLEQKIVIVGDEFAYVWAGDRVKAKAFFKFVESRKYEIYSEDFFESKEVRSFLCDDISVIIVINDFKGAKGQGYFFFHNIEHTHLAVFGEIYYSGTGQGDIFGHLANMIPHLDRLNDTADHAIGAIETIGASLFAYHFLWGYGLKNHWGGAVETLYISDKGFTKLDNTLYVFWSANIESDKSYRFGFDEVIVKTKYFKGILNYRVFNNHDHRDEIISIPSFSSKIEDISSIQDADFEFENSKRVVNILRVVDKGHIKEMLFLPMPGDEFFSNFRINLSQEQLLSYEFTLYLYKKLIKNTGLPTPKAIEAVNGSVFGDNLSIVKELQKCT